MNLSKLVLSPKIKIYRKKGGAYIVDRSTGKYKFYNESATDWLSIFESTPMPFEDALNKILADYPEELYSEISNDFREFIIDLANRKILVEQDDVCAETKDSSCYPQAECESQLIESLPSATIEVTERCNEHCIHCYLPDARKLKGESLTIEEIEGCIDQLITLKAEKVTFTGGEAMLHPNLIEAIKYAKAKGLYVSVLSNLTRLTPDLENIISTSDNTSVQVSLYSVTEDIHDNITGLKGSCKRTKEAILKLRSLGVDVTASMAVMKENYRDVCNVMDFAMANNLSLQFDYIMMAQSDFDKSNLKHRISLAETEHFFRLMLNHNRDFGLGILKKNNFAKGENLEASICYVATDGCCIASNGDVYLCPSWQDISLGNIRNKKLFDIWNNNAILTRMRDLTLSQIHGCAECDYRIFCCICLARNYYENGGNMFVPTKETCQAAKLGKRLYQEYTQENVE